MKLRFAVIIIAILIASLFLAACQPQAPAPEAPPTEATAADAPAAGAEVVLEVSNGEKTVSLTMEDLKKMPAAEGQAGLKSSTGQIYPPALYKGVLLTDLLNQVGGLDPAMAIQIEASDGYAMTFSPTQVEKGEFITYDPGTGDEMQKAGTLRILVAYEKDGKPLNTDEEGLLRIVVISEKPNQVVDGHWSIKWVSKVNFKPLAAEWTLSLEGAIQDEIDRGSFESCSTGNCHPSEWKDGAAQTWRGTPLWVLLGRVDDDLKHDTGAFNRKLAEAGYTVEVVAVDGYSVKLDSARIKGDPEILVANSVNGNPLTDKDFPLKLVGPNLSKKEMAGGIAKIILHMDEKPAEAQPTTPPEPTKAAESSAPAEGALVIAGMVDGEKGWSLEELKALEQVKLTVEHPKKGTQDVEGVRLNALLDLAGAKTDAKTLVLVADDGYKAEVPLSAVRAQPDCLIAFNESGGLKSVMPGMESNLWVKGVVRIELK